MLRRHSPTRLPVALAASALLASLAACGGGGSDSQASASGIDDDTATAYSADATTIQNDSSNAADQAILAMQVALAGSGQASPGEVRETAQGVGSAAASPSRTLNCAGGGTVTLTISGGTAASVQNGSFDTGEVYTAVFAACKGAVGAAQLDGQLAMTIASASGSTANGSLSVDLVATALVLTTARGTAQLDGTAHRDLTVATDGSGVVHWTSHYTSPGLTLATHYNARSSTFTLTAVDIQRTATLAGGVLQSSTITGTHTLAGVLPRGSFSTTVSTTGGATYGADGAPVAGQWTVTLPQTTIGVAVANGTVTITIDRNKDGTIDRTITLPIAQFVAALG